MKKILSLCLAVVMVLGMFAMGVSAEETDETTTPAFKEWKLVLNDGIEIKFVFEGLTAGEKYTVTMESEAGYVQVQPTADADGLVTATYSMLNPTMFEVDVTAVLTDDNDLRVEREAGAVSIMEYCNNVLASMDYSDELHALIVDLLNYAYATERYLDDEAADPAAPTVTVGRDLTNEEKAIFAAVTDSTKYTGQLGDIVDVYRKIGITLPKTAGTSDIMSMFSGAAKQRELPVDRSTVAEEKLYLYDMIVENGWGGSWFSSTYRNKLSAGDFKVGDILYFYGTEVKHWFLFYVGNDRFVGWNSTTNANTGIYTMENVVDIICNGGGDYSYTLGGVETTMSTGTVRYYVLLRPSQILSSISIDTEIPDGVKNHIVGTTVVPGDMSVITTPDQSGNAVTFGAAMPILGESIGYRFYITSEIPVGAEIKGQLAGDDAAAVDLTVKTQDDPSSDYYGMKYVDFTALTPADLSKVVSVVVNDAEGNPLSITKEFSGASYAVYMLEKGDAKLQNLVAAMMVYSQGVKNYVAAGREYNSTLIDMEDCTNFAAVQYKISQLANLPPEEVAEIAASRKWSPNNFIKWVYAQAGITVNGYASFAGSVNDVRYRAEDISNYLNTALVGKLESLEDLQVGDFVLARNGAVASYLSSSREGFESGDPYVGEYTCFVYLGNETFACGHNGSYDFRLMTFDDFDDTATEVNEDFFNASTNWMVLYILRASNFIGANAPAPAAE